MTARLPAPRWQTPLPANVAGSWGPYVEAWALRELGIRFDRWQRRGINRALAFDDAGKLVHRIYLLSVGRQNGKTGGARSVVGWALTDRLTPDWRQIMGLAHDRAQARVPYEAVLADLEPIRRRYPRGGLHLTRYLGIRSDLYGRHREYHVASREARDAIRTYSIDLGLFDEVRTQTGYDTWAALEPTTRARPDPLILLLSTAGSDRSILLRDMWERGLRIIDGAEPAAGFGMTWYAAPDDIDPRSPAAIRAANPAVAEGRIPLKVVADSYYTLSPATYRQETLNLWSEGADEWLPPGTWPATEGPQPKAGVRIVFGAEAVPTWRRCTVTVAIVTDAGAWVGVAGELDSSRTSKASIAPAELIRLVSRLAGEWKPAEVAYSAQAAAAPHLKAWAEGAGIRAIELGPRQIRSASGLFRSELIGRRLTHGPDPLLAQQVRLARPSADLSTGDWFFSIRDSLGEIDALRAAAWAAWAAIAPEDAQPVPRIHL